MKKTLLILTAFCIGYFCIAATSKNISIYNVETEAETIMDQLYENKNVETYKFVIDNAIEDGCINITYYIDDEVVKNYNNVLIFQEETTYFFVGTTSKCLILRPDENHKRFHNGKTDVSNIDEGFVNALKNVKYIRKEKNTIRTNDLIMQFENNLNGHNYRIEIKYNIDILS